LINKYNMKDWKDILVVSELMNNKNKIVVATEGIYCQEPVYAFIDRNNSSVIFIPKTFDELLHKIDSETVLDVFLDKITQYKTEGYIVVCDSITTHNFDRFNPIDWWGN